MRCRSLLLAAAAAAAVTGVSTSCQSAYEKWPQPIVDEIAKALGGADRILALKTLSFEGEANGTLLADEPRETVATPSARSAYAQSMALAVRDWSIENTRESAQNQPAVRQLFGVRGGAAHDTGSDGSSTADPSDELQNFRRMVWYHHPVTIIRAALEGASQCCGRTFHERMFEIAVDPGVQTTLTVERSGLIWIITSDERPSGFRVSTMFEDYRDVEGLKLPFHMVTKIETSSASSLGTLRRSRDIDVRVKAYRLNAGALGPPGVPST